VQRDLFGRDLPAVLIDDHLSAATLVRTFHGHAERQRWMQVAQPVNGAVVLMSRPGSRSRSIHAGVYLDLDGGGVLHADEEAGVTYDSGLDLSLRNWRTEYYVPRTCS
jgi:hypothetical protein